MRIWSLSVELDAPFSQMKGMMIMILATRLTIKRVSILANHIWIRKNPKLQESVGDDTALGFPDGSAFCKWHSPCENAGIFVYVVFIRDIQSCEAWSFSAKKGLTPHGWRPCRHLLFVPELSALGQMAPRSLLEFCWELQLCVCPSELASTVVTFGGLVMLHIQLNLGRPLLVMKQLGSGSIITEYRLNN